MSNNNETTTKFKVDISELKKAMQEAKRSIAVANSEFKAVSSSMDDWSKSTDGISAKLKQLDTTLSAQKTVLSSLEAQYEAVVKEQGENSKAADDLIIKINNQKAAINGTQKQIEKWTTSLNDLESESGQAESAADGLGDSLKEAGKDAEDAEDGFTVLKATIADLAAKAISSAVGALKDFVAQAGEVDKAVNGLQTSTGATAKEMKQYEKVMKDIYNSNYGESYDDVADSMSKVLQTMGDLSDVDLKNITTNGLALRDTFGFEMTESMRAVNSLMKQFGISADEAYNLIAQGAQNGLNQNDDLLDVINEYSVQFKNSGYDANQMFNMLKNGADAGVWSVDKLGDAVKEMNIRFSDGTVADALAENAKALGLSSKEVKSLQTEYNKGGESAQKAVGKMIDSILSVKDETKQYQLGVSVFGTMWEDLGAEAIKALMSTEGELNATKKTMDDIKNTKYDDLGSSLQQLGRMFKDEILTPIAEHIVPKLQEFVTYAIDNFSKIKQTVLDVVGVFNAWSPAIAAVATALAGIGIIGLVNNLSAIGTAMVTAITSTKLWAAAQWLLNTAMSANPIGLIITAIAALVAAFVILWNKSDAFREFWINLWNNIVSFISTTVQKIRNFFVTLGTNISTAFSNVWSTIVKIFSPAVTWFSKLFTSVFNTLKSTIDVIIGLIKGIWTVITTVFSPLLAWVGTHITTPLTTAFTTVWNTLKTGATNAWNGIKTVFSTVATFFKDTFTKAWTAVKNVFSVGGKIFDGIKEGIVSMFKTIVNAIIRGINRVISVPFNAINAALNTIRNVGIADMKPFAGLPSISVPSIPELARGGILKRGQVGLLEGDGAEAVVPLEKNTQWLRAVAKQMAKELGVSGSSSVTGGVGFGGVVNNYNQTINSPKALTRLEIYRQSKNLLAFNGGA